MVSAITDSSLAKTRYCARYWRWVINYAKTWLSIIHCLKHTLHFKRWLNLYYRWLVAIIPKVILNNILKCRYNDKQ